MGEAGSLHRPARRLTAGGAETLDEVVAEEVAVALVYNGVSHAVMMATPCDLEDFARGFSLTERIVEKPSEIYDVEVEEVERGGRGRGFRVGRHPARKVSRAAIQRAMAALPAEQKINRANGATHAAGWARADGSLVAVRED